MVRAHPILTCAAALYLAGLIAFTFLTPGGDEQPSPWWTFLIFAVGGALLAMLSDPRRWWVALGFVWLAAAWVEAAQAVWGPDGRARLEDLALGVAGGALGVGAAAAARVIAARRVLSAAAEAPQPR